MSKHRLSDNALDTDTTSPVIERIVASDLTKTTSPGVLSIHPGLESVRRELFTNLSPIEFQSRYIKLLTVDSRLIVQSPEANNRGAEAYWIKYGRTPVAVVILHFYSWQILAPQICILASRKNGRNIDLRLARFEELVVTKIVPRLAAEVAFLWVAPVHRGKGLGRLLFEKALSVFDFLLGKGGVGFMIARGSLSRDKGYMILRHLLDDKTNAFVSADELSATLGIDCTRFPVHPDSLPTVALAESAGMKFLGYMKNTSSIYGKIW